MSESTTDMSICRVRPNLPHAQHILTPLRNEKNKDKTKQTRRTSLKNVFLKSVNSNRETEIEGQREKSKSKSKTYSRIVAFYIRSDWTYLTASPCYSTDILRTNT